MTETKLPVVAVIPSLNPDEKLLGTVHGLQAQGFDQIILVDDGSRDACRPCFDQLEAEGCRVLRHEVNRGKGRVLKTAFAAYLQDYDLAEYVGVVTADADGQHLPEDIRKTAEALVQSATGEQSAPPCGQLVLGTRNFDEPQVPFKSRNGNKITTEVFQLLYGKRINDTQTGLRAISNAFLHTCLEVKGERFEYEINMLIAAVRAKTDIREVLIRTVYFNDNRETHFHPVKDSLKIYGVMLGSFLRFACSGLVSVVVDQGLFALLQKLVFRALSAGQAILWATLLARAVSSLLNYSMNRSLVFQETGGAGKSLARYYGLCVCQAAASALGVAALHALTAADPSVLKLLVDTVLFFVSYRVQQGWVFRKEG